MDARKYRFGFWIGEHEARFEVLHHQGRVSSPHDVAPSSLAKAAASKRASTEPGTDFCHLQVHHTSTHSCHHTLTASRQPGFC